MRQLILARDRVETLTRSLKVGDVFYATVTTKIDRGRYAVRFQNTEFIAVYQGLLQTGAQLRVMVQQLRPQIVFRILSEHELGFAVDTHVKNLEKYARAVSGLVAFVPSCADFLSTACVTVEALLDEAHKAHDDIRKAMTELRQQLVDMVAFSSNESLCGAVQQAGEIRKAKADTVLQEMIALCDTLIATWGSHYDERFTDLCICLREAIRKIYISITVECAINRSSVLARKGVQMFQLVYMNGNVYQQVTMFYRAPFESGQPIRVLAHNDARDICDCIWYDTEKRIIVNSELAPSPILGLFQSAQREGYSVSITPVDTILADMLGAGKCTEMHILKPINFNFVV